MTVRSKWREAYKPEDWSNPGVVHKVKLVRAMSCTLERLLRIKWYTGLREALDYVNRRKDAIIMKELLDE